MTVVDVNTGRFTGSGGTLEETVTKNNLEAAEEIVRQLRLRDIGGIIVVDFIDMVLESNRDLVLRRLVECLGRDRTRHQVAEVTSLGLVQMTRKRIGTGLLEAFSEECEHCKGRGVIIHDHPVEAGGRGPSADEGRGRRGRTGRGRGRSADAPAEPVKPSPMALAGTKPHPEPIVPPDDEPEDAGAEDATPDDRPDERAADTPVEVTWAGYVTPDEPSDDSADEATDADAGASGVPADAAEAPAPIVVTSTRRRRAGRPAGPPAAIEDVDTAEADEPLPTGGEDELEPAPVDAADDTDAEAGPDDHGSHSLLHVPVKKKGSRKR
jgi:ribonuclease E